jgi:alpha-glutamyl/putrescinyl thymine pyrophosphorylase clade 1
MDEIYGQTLALDLGSPVAPKPRARSVGYVDKTPVIATPVFDAYWRFAAERQEIFYRRLKGSRASYLTRDQVLAQFKFTNTYRASDRVSQFLIRNVIYRDDLPDDVENLFYRILLFKLFNKIETWQLLEESAGPMVWENYNYERIEKTLAQRFHSGDTIYSAAYIMPSAGGRFGHPLKHQNHLRLIEFLMKEAYPRRLADCRTMSDAFRLMQSAPSIGPFLAYQFVTDLNYSNITDFSEDEFVVPGPGALDGISKCFSNYKELSPESIIRFMYQDQEKHFREQGIKFRNLWGRPLQLIDCQNVFCEISKYARVAFPAIAGSAGRIRIKQKFVAKAALSSPWYPPKWELNSKIAADLAKQRP